MKIMIFQYLNGYETMQVGGQKDKLMITTFIQGIEYLIKNNIIVIPQTLNNSGSGS